MYIYYFIIKTKNMFGTKKTKLNNSDKQKIRARFISKAQEYQNLSLDELKSKLNDKMSSTDKMALNMIIDNHIKKSITEQQEKEHAITRNDSIDSQEAKSGNTDTNECITEQEVNG